MGQGAAWGAGILLLALLVVGQAAGQQLRVGGSSTLYPASLMFAGEIEERLAGTTAEVSFAGTGGGFDLLCKGAAEVIGASRLATAEENSACEAGGVEYLAFPVALDAIMVVVSEENDWVTCLDLEELRRLWSGGPEGVERWSELRPEWPDREITFNAPGVASGTYDYWNRHVLGPDIQMRTDYYPSEDDRQLAQLTATDRDAISFFGRAQLELSEGGLRALAVDDGSGCLEPERVDSGGRWPFLRPLFLYVSAAAASSEAELQPAVTALVQAFLSTGGQERLRQAGYLPLDERVRLEALARFRDRVRGPLVADYGGRSLLRMLPGGWTQRQVVLRGRLLELEREVQSVGVVHSRFDTLLQGLLDSTRSSLDDSL